MQSLFGHGQVIFMDIFQFILEFLRPVADTLPGVLVPEFDAIRPQDHAQTDRPS